MSTKMSQAEYNKTREKYKKRYTRENRPKQKAILWQKIEDLKIHYQSKKSKQ